MSAQLASSRIEPAEGERRLCSAISEVPGRDSASANGRPSRPVLHLALELGQRPLVLAPVRSPRAWPPPGRPDARSRPARLHVAVEHVARGARVDRLLGRRGARRRASRHGRPRRSRRPRSSRPCERSVPVVPSSTERRTAAFSSGVPAPTAASSAGSIPKSCGTHVVGVEAVRRSARPRAWARPPRTRRAHRRSTLPVPSPCRELSARGRSPRGSPASRHADHLAGRARRVRERPEEVEDRAHRERLAHRHHVLHRLVVERGEHEAEAHRLGCSRPRAPGPRSMLRPQRLQHVGRAAAARGRAVAVLGHQAARAGGDQRRGGRDVEGGRGRPRCRRCPRGRRRPPPARRARAWRAPAR